MSTDDGMLPVDVAEGIALDHNLHVLGEFFRGGGLSRVEMSFAGTSDEGNIQRIAYAASGDDPENVPYEISEAMVERLQDVEHNADRSMARRVDAGPMMLRDALEEVGLSILEQFDSAWQEGMGASGSIRIDSFGVADLKFGQRRVNEYNRKYMPVANPLTAGTEEPSPGL